MIKGLQTASCQYNREGTKHKESLQYFTQLIFCYKLQVDWLELNKLFCFSFQQLMNVYLAFLLYNHKCIKIKNFNNNIFLTFYYVTQIEIEYKCALVGFEMILQLLIQVIRHNFRKIFKKEYF